MTATAAYVRQSQLEEARVQEDTRFRQTGSTTRPTCRACGSTTRPTWRACGTSGRRWRECGKCSRSASKCSGNASKWRVGRARPTSACFSCCWLHCGMVAAKPLPPLRPHIIKGCKGSIGKEFVTYLKIC
nr:uncharacterized protein LOC129383573 [Dermacentor andersoni]